jgi:hypothetical protein
MEIFTSNVCNTGRCDRMTAIDKHILDICRESDLKQYEEWLPKRNRFDNND